MILLTPRTTEKAYALSSRTNTYVFTVPLSATKQQIRESVTERFDVAVTDVRTAVQTGKSVRYSRGKNRYPGTASRKNTKKAYVTLAENNSIAVFDANATEENA